MAWFLGPNSVMVLYLDPLGKVGYAGGTSMGCEGEGGKGARISQVDAESDCHIVRPVNRSF